MLTICCLPFCAQRKLFRKYYFYSQIHFGLIFSELLAAAMCKYYTYNILLWTCACIYYNLMNEIFVIADSEGLINVVFLWHAACALKKIISYLLHIMGDDGFMRNSRADLYSRRAHCTNIYVYFLCVCCDCCILLLLPPHCSVLILNCGMFRFSIWEKFICYENKLK